MVCSKHKKIDFACMDCWCPPGKKSNALHLECSQSIDEHGAPYYYKHDKSCTAKHELYIGKAITAGMQDSVMARSALMHVEKVVTKAMLDIIQYGEAIVPMADFKCDAETNKDAPAGYMRAEITISDEMADLIKKRMMPDEWELFISTLHRPEGVPACAELVKDSAGKWIWSWVSLSFKVDDSGNTVV